MLQRIQIMMMHRRVFPLLPWYVNASLEEDRVPEVEAHLEACSLCRREAEELQAFEVRLQEHCEQLAEAASSDSWRGRLGELPAQPAQVVPLEADRQGRAAASVRPAPSGQAPVLAWWQAWVPRLAALALTLMLGASLYQNYRQHRLIAEYETPSGVHPYILQPTSRGTEEVELAKEARYLLLRVRGIQPMQQYRLSFAVGPQVADPLFDVVFFSDELGEALVSIPAGDLQSGACTVLVSQTAAPGAEPAEYRFQLIRK